MWGDDMGEIVGRAVSREQALDTLTNAKECIPDKRKPAYTAALNRVRYEFNRHEPVTPTVTNGWTRCGNCGAEIRRADLYCSNCGREVKRS